MSAKCCICGKELVGGSLAIFFVGSNGDEKQLCEECKKQSDLFFHGEDEENAVEYFMSHVDMITDMEVQRFIDSYMGKGSIPPDNSVMVKKSVIQDDNVEKAETISAENASEQDKHDVDTISAFAACIADDPIRINLCILGASTIISLIFFRCAIESSMSIFL